MKNISKGKIEKRMKKKSDSDLVKTIIQLKRSNLEVAKELAKPKRRWSAVNLKDLSHVEGDVLVAGKVLSAGDLLSPKKVVAWSFSQKAREKIKDSKGKAILLTEELNKNPELKGLSIVR